MSLHEPQQSSRRDARRTVTSPFVVAGLAMATLVTALLVGPTPAAAHTGFESSVPGDGDIVGEPVSTVRISFTGPATPTGDEFLALDASGELRTPTETATEDGLTYVLTFDPPLAGGQVGLRWSVQAPDAHPIDGSFAFTVNAPVPPPSTAAAADEAASNGRSSDASGSSGPAADRSSANNRAAGEAASPGPVADESSANAPNADATTSDGRAADQSTSRRQDPLSDAGSAASEVSEPAAATPAPTLEEFLTADDSGAGEGVGLIGRVLGLIGVALLVGGAGFLATTLRGRRSEIRRGLSAVRILGLVVAAGAALELVGLHLADTLDAAAMFTTPGLAMGLRLVGGLAVAAGIVATIATDGSGTRSLSAAVLETTRPSPATLEAMESSRWQPRRSMMAWVGLAAILVSFGFDGHTVSEGPRIAHALVSIVHVAAGSVWAGGVASMAAVAWWRYRRGESTGAAQLVVRFSSVATVSLVAVATAGAVMAWFVLDSVGELFETEWGRILLLKTAFVAIAASGGAYNHFRLLPALKAAPEDEELAGELRSAVTAEAIILAFVVVVTAWLVAAAS